MREKTERGTTAEGRLEEREVHRLRSLIRCGCVVYAAVAALAPQIHKYASAAAAWGPQHHRHHRRMGHHSRRTSARARNHMYFRRMSVCRTRSRSITCGTASRGEFSVMAFNRPL